MNFHLEITLRCNARCPQCSRHCNVLDYGDTDMTMGQVDRFIDDVLRHDQKLGKIALQGGEPTLHPLLKDFVDRLYERLYPHHVGCIQIDTNDLIPLPPGIEGKPGMVIQRSRPGSLVRQQHRCQWVAPKDTGQKLAHCVVPEICGYCYSVFGYSPCGAGGAIARLFRLPQFYSFEFPASGDAHFGNFREVLCALCQRGAKKPLKVSDPKYRGKKPISPSFQKALDEWKNSPPTYPHIEERKDDDPVR